MAKRQRSIFESDTPFEEIQTVAKQVQQDTLEQIPPKEKEKKTVARKTKKTQPKKIKSVAKEKPKNEKPMYLYVDVEHHRKAKINAAVKGMKLGEYIEWLIDQDAN